MRSFLERLKAEILFVDIEAGSLKDDSIAFIMKQEKMIMKLMR